MKGDFSYFPFDQSDDYSGVLHQQGRVLLDRDWNAKAQIDARWQHTAAADAFGILPPISRLTRDQAMYHFISGYTARLAGTEVGLTEPQATFSTCFGAPFMPRHPSVYAEMLGERMDRFNVPVWLVNTGWTGGPAGDGGERMNITWTRQMVRAALSGRLNDVPTRRDPNFGFEVPTTCPDVPAEVLWPRDTWADKAAYDARARQLAQMFVDNFRAYEDRVSAAVSGAGPQPG